MCPDADFDEPNADHTASQSGGAASHLVSGQTTVRLRATSGMQWRATTTYVATQQTPWGVNANGQTYGTDIGSNSPDLTAVTTTDGRQGYALTTDLNGPQPTSPAEALALNDAYPNGRDVAVYQSDGETRVGTFHIQ